MGYFNINGGAGLGDLVIPSFPVRRGDRVIRIPLVLRKIPRGMGLGAAELSRPGPTGGTEIVDSSGNVIYTEAFVAANPSLLTSLGGGCPGGELPEWYPGGESVCADQSAVVPGEGVSPYAQFNYSEGGSCQVDGWCLTGTNPADPNSYTWQGGGQPTTLNPAIVMSAAPLPTAFNTPATSVPVPNQTPLPGAVKVGTDPLLPSTLPSNPKPLFTAPNSTPAVPASATFTNVSRPGQSSFQVGDSWQLVITGGPNQPVSGSASQNGKSLGTTSYGSTDSTGKLVLTGTMDATTVGNWAQLWTVGASPAPVLNFAVAPLAGAPNSTAPAAGSSSDALSFLTNSVTIPGLNISVPIWALGAGAIAALWLMSSAGSRR